MRIESYEPTRPAAALAPAVPGPAAASGGAPAGLSIGDTRRAAELIASLVAGFTAPDAARMEDAAMALDTVPTAIAGALDGLLGDGWVAITLRGVDGSSTRMEETSYAGVWRTHRHPANGMPATRSVELGMLPAVIVPTLARLTRTPPAPATAGSDRLRTIYAEIARRAQKVRPESPVTVINLTLSGLDEADVQALTERLGSGPVSGVCLGFNTTRFASTAVQNVWRVRYFDQAERLVLDTLEIVQVPECTVATAEAVRQSAARLAELARSIKP